MPYMVWGLEPVCSIIGLTWELRIGYSLKGYRWAGCSLEISLKAPPLTGLWFLTIEYSFKRVGLDLIVLVVATPPNLDSLTKRFICWVSYILTPDGTFVRFCSVFATVFLRMLVTYSATFRFLELSPYISLEAKSVDLNVLLGFPGGFLKVLLALNNDDWSVPWG